MERRYYLASGNDEAIVLDFFKRRNGAFDNATAIARKHGGEAVTNGRGMAGVVFKGDVPEGWKVAGHLSDGRTYHTPLRKSKAGKEACKEIQSVRIPGASDLHSEFSNDGGVFADADGRHGFSIHYITAEIVKGQCIIQVPEKMQFDPPESRLLKQSEYWQIKEAAEAPHA